jgi:hypothetical protein
LPLFFFGELQLAIIAQLSTNKCGKRYKEYGRDHFQLRMVFAGNGS